MRYGNPGFMQEEGRMNVPKAFLALALSVVLALGLVACGSEMGGTESKVTAMAGGKPVADAGPDQDVVTGSVVTLDGSGSYDPQGGTLSYSWSFTSMPTGSTAALSNSTAVDPTFTADKDGSYVVSLTVSVGNKRSAPDSVTITAAGPGTLHLTFGASGVATYDSSIDDAGLSVAVQSDGKALVAGRRYNGSDYDIVLLRYNTDGTLDTTFGSSGVATYDSGYIDYFYSVAVQSDGKALVTGTSYNGPNSNDLVLLRFNTNGTLDTTFGSSGVATYDGGVYDEGKSVAVQSDGKALVAGFSYNTSNNADIALLRFNTNGTLDTTFGSSGVATYDGGYYDYGRSVAVQSDGKALVTGVSYSTSYNEDIALLRFNADGTLDTTFGSSGVATYDSGSFDDSGHSVAVQSDGKALVAGGSDAGQYYGKYRIMLLRFNTDGTLDTTFGSSGVSGYNSSYNDFGASVTVQADGKALVAGISNNGSDNDLVLLRFNTDGTRDTTYGTSGVATYDGGFADVGTSVTVQSDGKALVAGMSNNGSDNDLVLLRFK